MPAAKSSLVNVSESFTLKGSYSSTSSAVVSDNQLLKVSHGGTACVCIQCLLKSFVCLDMLNEFPCL